MALNADELGKAINDRIEAARPEIAKLYQSGDAAGGGKKCWIEVATAIIEHFKANAEVTPNGSPAFEADGNPVTGKGKIT